MLSVIVGGPEGRDLVVLVLSIRGGDLGIRLGSSKLLDSRYTRPNKAILIDKKTKTIIKLDKIN
jgi:hypothetical protein